MDPPEDVFLCEDDLILSQVNHKQFKDDVYKKSEIRLECTVKKYVEKGVIKRKAVDIRIIESNL